MVLLGCATGQWRARSALHNLLLSIKYLMVTNGDTAGSLKNSSTPSPGILGGAGRASSRPKPDAGIIDSPTSPLSPLSAVWRVCDIDVEIVGLFAADAVLITTRTRRAAEIQRCAINGNEGRGSNARHCLKLVARKAVRLHGDAMSACR